MKSRDAVIRRVLIRLRDHFTGHGWSPSKGPATMLVMQGKAGPGVEHILLVSEPLSSDQLPSKEVLGLSCSVNVTFKDAESVVCSVFGYDPETYAGLSASLALCQVAPKGSCHLGVHLISPESENSLRRLTDDYHAHLEPVLKQLESVSVFERDDYVPPGVSEWSWNIRRAAHYYVHKPKDEALKYAELLERTAHQAHAALGEQPGGERPLVLGTVDAAVQAGKRRAVEDAMRVASTLRDWILQKRPKRI